MLFDVDFAISNFFVALTGIPVTLIITAVAVFVGMPLGLGVCLLRGSKIVPLKYLMTLYISLMRGIPGVVLIFLVYAAVPALVQQGLASFDIKIKLADINPIWYAFFVFIIKYGATFAEMWKAGLSSVHRGQMEAAKVCGLNSLQAYRHIIVPQALATIAPSFCSTTLTILKETSLVFIMTVQDITAKSKIAAGLEYKYLEGFVDALVVYVIVCVTLELLLKRWEIRLNNYRNTGLAK